MLQAKLKEICAKPVLEAHPVAYFNPQFLYQRDDTCKGDVVRCLYVGNLTKAKGVRYLTDALAVVSQHGYQVALDIVGTGPLEKEVAAWTNKTGIPCRLHGYIPHGPALFALYRSADIFVFPSLSEGFPRVIYEAMGQSLPIITTAVGGIPMVLTHEETALLVPPRSAEAIAEAIIRLITDPELRQRLIRNAFAIAELVWHQNPAEQIAQWVFEYIFRKWRDKG